MAKLTPQDMTLLKHYADEGNRELYWNYLAQIPGNDGYGLLALGVVRNDNMPGAVANNYAQQHGGKKLSEREWEDFGQQLIEEDYERRRVQYERYADPARALNLPVKDVQEAHDKTFSDHRLDPNAWTPRLLLEAARSKGGEQAAERIWSNMLDNSMLGLDRGWDTTRDVGKYMSLPDAAGYTGRLAYASALATLDRSNVDPNIIGANSVYYEYSARDRSWSMVSQGGMDHIAIPRKITDAEKLEELNDTRQLRLERQEKATQFHPNDPYRQILSSPRTLTHNELQTDPSQQSRYAELGTIAPLPADFAPALQLPQDMRDPSHPGHAAYAHALGLVQRMEQTEKIASGSHSEVLAARIAADANEQKQGITHIEMGRDAQIHVIERHYAMSEGKRFSLSAETAMSEGIEASSERWLHARSSHYLSSSPAAIRSDEQSIELARLSTADQQMFTRIRGRVPAQLGDELVANATLEAKRCGINRAEQIEGVTMAGDRLCVLGTKIGQKAIVDAGSPQPSLQQSLEEITAINQQQQQAAQTRQHEHERLQERAQAMQMG